MGGSLCCTCSAKDPISATPPTDIDKYRGGEIQDEGSCLPEEQCRAEELLAVAPQASENQVDVPVADSTGIAACDGGLGKADDAGAVKQAERQRLLDNAVKAVARSQLHSASALVASAHSVKREMTDTLLAGVALPPTLELLPSVLERVSLIQAACRVPDTNAGGWKKFDIDGVEDSCFWRSWETSSGTLRLIISWVAPGSMAQQVAALRKPDLAEPLWNGAAWDMRSQQVDGTVLVRWLQRDPFVMRKAEVYLERNLCDCMEEENPCWVLLERSPDVEGFEDFVGRYGAFDIPAKPSGFMRAITSESGRVLEPVAKDRVRVTMALSLKLPAVIRWAISDRLLKTGMSFVAKSTMADWKRIIDGWGSLEYDRHIREEEAVFYGPLTERVDTYLRKREAFTP